MRREVDAGYVAMRAATAATSRSTSCRRTRTVVILTIGRWDERTDDGHLAWPRPHGQPEASCSRAGARPAWARRRRRWTGTARRCCGGRAASSRRGRGPVVVVRAPGPGAARPAGRGRGASRTPREGRGPLQGLAGRAGRRGSSTGRRRLRLLHRHAVPAPGVRRARCSRALRAEVDVALPHLGGYRQPLAAAYRTALAPRGRARSSPQTGCARRSSSRPSAVRLDERPLLADRSSRRSTPSSTPCSTSTSPRDYDAARARPAPEVDRPRASACCGHRAASGPARCARRTLGEAAAAVGLPLDGHVVAALNGDQIARDAAEPLADRRQGGVPLRGRRGLSARTRRERRHAPRRLLRPRARRRPRPTASAATLALPDAVLRAYLGGAGLGAWLMHRAGAAGRRPARPRRRRSPSCSPRWSARR